MKKNKGAMSLFALLAMLFFLIFIMVAYNNVASKGKTQVETIGVLIDLYSSDETASGIYTQELYGGDLTSSIKSKTTDEADVIEGTNGIDKISSGDYIFLNGKIYKNP